MEGTVVKVTCEFYLGDRSPEEPHVAGKFRSYLQCRYFVSDALCPSGVTPLVLFFQDLRDGFRQKLIENILERYHLQRF